MKPRHHPFFLLPSNKSWKHTSSNHHKQGFSITTKKISYSLIEPEVLLYVPACSCKFYAHAVHLHPILIAPFQSEAYLEPSRTSAMNLFCENSERLKAAHYFRRKAPS